MIRVSNARLRAALARGFLFALAFASTAARGQEKPAAVYDEWRLLEPAEEMVEYKNRLRDGGFDETSRSFLVKTALPQLGLPKNRATIDRVRRRMREVLCGDAGSDPRAAAAAMQAVTDVMIPTARDAKADIVLRVNAILLVGELRAQGTKPWAPAVGPLAAVVGDDSLPAAVRIAAAAGLARHVEADPVARAADVGPAVLKLAGAPLAGVDPLAADWLRSRALAMLARMGVAAPAGTAGMAATILRDATRPIDVRVRAAAALGACTREAGEVDVTAAVDGIRALATAALATTQVALERRELAGRIAGGDAGQPLPQRPPELGLQWGAPAPDGDPDSPVYRRDAWLLATLADALAPAQGETGLARLAGGGADSVADLARALRDGAGQLDAQPDAGSLRAAIKALADAGQPGPRAPGEQDPAPADDAAAGAGAEGVPFGDR